MNVISTFPPYLSSCKRRKSRVESRQHGFELLEVDQPSVIQIYNDAMGAPILLIKD